MIILTNDRVMLGIMVLKTPCGTNSRGLRPDRRESQCKEYIFSYIRLLKAPTSGANPAAPTVGALGQTTGNIARCPFKIKLFQALVSFFQDRCPLLIGLLPSQQPHSNCLRPALSVCSIQRPCHCGVSIIDHRPHLASGTSTINSFRTSK